MDGLKTPSTVLCIVLPLKEVAEEDVAGRLSLEGGHWGANYLMILRTCRKSSLTGVLQLSV